MQGQVIAFPKYDFYATKELLSAYAAGPERLAAAIPNLTEDELRNRARGSASWSIQEIVLHVTDSELQGAFRIRKAWAEPGADFPGYNQDLWTKELGHQQSDADARALSLQLFALLRRTTAQIFEQAEDADWGRRWGKHPEFGSLTLRNLLELYADHSERHLEQILTIRRLLGKPLNFPMLLPQRLF
jgi:uncharacterized damage-inducible protein DinB